MAGMKAETKQRNKMKTIKEKPFKLVQTSAITVNILINRDGHEKFAGVFNPKHNKFNFSDSAYAQFDTAELTHLLMMTKQLVK